MARARLASDEKGPSGRRSSHVRTPRASPIPERAPFQRFNGSDARWRARASSPRPRKSGRSGLLDRGMHQTRFELPRRRTFRRRRANELASFHRKCLLHVRDARPARPRHNPGECGAGEQPADFGRHHRPNHPTRAGGMEGSVDQQRFNRSDREVKGDCNQPAYNAQDYREREEMLRLVGEIPPAMPRKGTRIAGKRREFRATRAHVSAPQPRRSRGRLVRARLSASSPDTPTLFLLRRSSNVAPHHGFPARYVATPTSFSSAAILSLARAVGR